MPTISYKGYDFEVDHQPTQEEFSQMQAQVDKLPPKGAAAPATAGGEGAAPAADINSKPAEQQSSVPYIVDQMKKGLAGTLALPNLAVDASQAVLDLASAPGRLGQKVRQMITPADNPEDAKKAWFIGNAPDKENVGGYKQASRAYEAILRADRAIAGKPEELTQDVQPPKDAFGGVSKSTEYMGKIANFVGGSIIPAAGPIATAQRKLLTAATELVGNMASGVSAVEAKEIFGNLAPKFGLTKQQGQEFGEQVGGMLGPGMIQMAGQGIAKASQTAIDGAAKANITGFSKEAQKAQAEVMLHREILDAANSNPTSAANLAELADLQKKMSDFKPGVAQATNSPALIAMTKQVSQSSPEALAKAAEVEARNVAAIQKFKEASFPTTNMPINTGARATRNAAEGVMLQDIQNTDRQMQVLSDRYNRTVDKQAVGQELRDLYWTKKGEVKGQLDKQIEDVYKTANDIGVKADMTDVRDTVKRIMADDRETFQQVPGTWRKILAEFGGAEKTAAPVQSRGSTMGIRREGINPPVAQEAATTEASFEKLHSLYKEANREWADMVMAQKPDVARKLSIVKDALETKVNQFQGPQYGMLGEKFGQFNQDYTAYANTFRKGAGGEVAKLTKNGFARDAEDIVDKVFLRSGDKSKGLDDFFRVYGNDERAAELLRDGLVDNFSRKAVDSSGNFSAVGARSWMKQNERALEQLPNLRAELQGTTDTAGALVQRRRELVAQRQILDKSVLSAAAREQRPELLVEAGMKDPRMFKALLSSSKTQESRDSLARSIVDMAVDKNNPLEFITKNETTLKPVMDALGKEHWSNLQTLAKAEDIANRTKTPSTVELSRIQDPLEQAVGTSGKSLLSKLQNVKAGRTSDVYQLADVAGRYVYKIRTEELSRLRQAALFDPEVATVLARVVRQDRPKNADLLDLKAIAFQHGISIGSQALQVRSREEQKSPEEKAKINKQSTEGIGLWR